MRSSAPGGRRRAAEARFLPDVRVPPPGPRARAIVARDRKVVSPASPRAYPLVVERGEGPYVWDVDGNRYLDFTSGVAVNALGHAHPEIVRVVAQQARNFLHMAGPDFYYDVMVEFTEKLCSIAPGKSPRMAFLTNSGTEAVEAAIKLSRYATRRPFLVAFYGGFHGRSLGSLSLTASKAVQRRHFGPLVAGVSHAPFGDLDFLEKVLFRKTVPPEDVAAIFVEAIQGEGGYAVAPKGFLPGLRALCDRHGILLVADEIQSGCGRTGKWWAVDHWGVVPDILCVSKPAGGGLPLGAMVSRADLQTWPPGAHSNTFGGNPVACAAGLRTLEIVEEQGLMDNARRVGDYFGRRLEELAARFPHAGSPRGLGLMRAMDIVRPRDGKPDPDRRNRVVQAAFERGLLLLGCGETAIRFLPPLTIERGHVDAAVEVLGKALRVS